MGKHLWCFCLISESYFQDRVLDTHFSHKDVDDLLPALASEGRYLGRLSPQPALRPSPGRQCKNGVKSKGTQCYWTLEMPGEKSPPIQCANVVLDGTGAWVVIGTLHPDFGHQINTNWDFELKHLWQKQSVQTSVVWWHLESHDGLLCKYPHLFSGFIFLFAKLTILPQHWTLNYNEFPVKQFLLATLKM
jgi:hypothetical protein